MEEEFAARVKDEDVDGAMLEPLPMYFGARKLIYDFVALINDIENLVVHNFF